jgi:signal transduction histidine kinase
VLIDLVFLGKFIAALKARQSILFFVFLMLLGCSRNDNTINTDIHSSLDSLDTYLSLANDDNLPYSDKQKYNKKAYLILINQKNDSLNTLNLFKVANRYYNMEDWISYKETSDFILERSIRSDDTRSTAKAYFYLGDYYKTKMVSDSAFRNYYAAEKLYLKINDELNLAKTLINKAHLQYDEGDFLESEVTVFKALRLLNKRKDVGSLLYSAYNLLGILYNSSEEYERSLEFHNKALKVLDDKSIIIDSQFAAASLNNIGFVYLSLKNYEQAKIYFQRGLQEKNLNKESAGLYAMLLDNLAYAKLKLKESDGLPDQFFEALKIRDSLNLESGIVLNKIHLSEYFVNNGDSAKAIQYSRQALTLSRRADTKLRNRLEVLKQIALVDPANASDYSREYIEINEKLQKEERKMGEKFSRIEYETNEIKDQNTSLNIQNRNLIYFFTIFGLVGIFFYIYKIQKAKNRELLFRQQQQVANEDIYNLMISQQDAIEAIRIKDKKRVSQDLHDGILGRMFGVRISLDSLDKLDDATAAVKRKNYLTELKEIEQDIREISHELNKEKSEVINNFVAIIEKLLDAQRSTFDTKLVSVIDSSIKWELVSNSIKINSYRIVQEALQNCNKYAKATMIEVTFKNEVDFLLLTIKDDGEGFNVDKVKKGIGLQNILYRTKECNGVLTIQSQKGEGTTITIRIPIDQKLKL